MLPKVLVLGTGGTVSSSHKNREDGLKPQYSVDEILNFVPLGKIADVYTDTPIKENGKSVYIDSTNMQPEYVQQVARRIYDAYRNENIHGVVILHGTDTMEESAADLTFELLYKKIPVVFTGSMDPPDKKGTDAVRNILHSIILAAYGYPGTYVVFNHRIISAARAKKVHPSHKDAFRTINFPQLGTFVDDEPRYKESTERLLRDHAERSECRDMELRDGYANKAHLLELYRGMRPSIIDYFFTEGYSGLLIEAFGTGGIPNRPKYRSLIPQIKYWSNERLIGIVSKAFKGQVTTDYEVTSSAIDAGAMSLYDMIPTTALSKTNWALAQTECIDDVKKLLLYPFEFEIDRLIPEKYRVSDEETERILSGEKRPQRCC